MVTALSQASAEAHAISQVDASAHALSELDEADDDGGGSGPR